MCKQITIKIQLLIFSLFYFLIAAPVHSANTDAASVIFDNTAGVNKTAIMSNMATNRAPNCNRNDVLTGDGNCFSLGSNDIQIIQNNGAGQLVSKIGVNNADSISDENKGTDKETYLFANGENLFDLDQFRTVAANIGELNPSGLNPDTYGTISYRKFIKNVALQRAMYGVVRVTIPVIKRGEVEAGSNFELCGESTGAECNYRCGPYPFTKIKSGHVICAMTIANSAQVIVYGTLMFDLIDGVTGEPVPIDQLPTTSLLLTSQIVVPVSINPANHNLATREMKTIQNIQTLTGANHCPDAALNNTSCSMLINTPISYSLVPQESKDMYQFKTGTALTAEVFSTLSRTDQYHILFPSGYANGWSTAFSKLGISASTWESWGFNVGTDSATITANDVRGGSFSDIPALISTGGLISLNHHTNISGLVYANQAIEIVQRGGDSPATAITPVLVPSYQYFNGALVVRNGFYFEATKPGGITMISNNPDSYSNTRLRNAAGIKGNFKAYVETINTPPGLVDEETPQIPQVSDRSIFTGQTAAQASSSSGPQWVEIRPK